MKKEYYTYFINLEKDLEKRADIITLSENLFKDYEIINAINGNALTKVELNEVYSEKKTLEYFNRPLTKGEVGCALSHIKIYKKILNQELPFALICEDDILFSEDLDEVINKCLNLDNWDCIMLGHFRGEDKFIETTASFWHSKNIVNDYKLVRFAEKSYGAHGYLLSKEGAKKLIKATSIKIDRPLDHYTGDSNYLKLYGVSPICISLNPRYLEKSNLKSDRAKIVTKFISQNTKTQNILRKIIKKLIHHLYIMKIKYTKQKKYEK